MKVANQIAFNATSLLNQNTGIAKYASKIAEAVSADPSIDPYFFYGATWSRKRINNPPTVTKTLLPKLRQYVPISYQIRSAIQEYTFSRGVQSIAPSVYFEPNIVSFKSDIPTVLTVHDLSWIYFPETHPIERVRFLNSKFERSLNKADRIITDATSVRSELVAEFSIDPERITAIPLGSDILISPLSKDKQRSILAHHQVNMGKYFLIVGTLEPRKNQLTAIKAHANLPSGIRTEFPLLHIGGDGWGNNSFRTEIRDAELSRSVRRLGYISQGELNVLLENATALVFPSLYEGFGLPVLEALSVGVPVIASNRASLPEVLGEGGLLIDPFDVRGFSDAMFRLSQDPEMRAILSVKATAQAANFSWEKCQKSHLDIFKEFLQ